MIGHLATHQLTDHLGVEDIGLPLVDRMLQLERVAGLGHDLEAPVGEDASHALAEQGGRAVTRG